MSSVSVLDIWRQPETFPSWTLKDWEVVLGQANYSALSGKLAQHFIDRDWMHAVPRQPRNYLEGWLRLADRQHHEARWEIDAIANALSGLETPVVLLKGSAYLMARLPNAKGRIFSDIDILIDRNHLEQAEGALFQAGWISQERDHYNIRYYREWMHEIPPMRHVQRNSVIDLHHNIVAPTSRFRVDGQKLLERIVSINGDSTARIFTLSPVDMVLHSATHLFQEGEFSHGIRDLLDIHELLSQFGSTPEFCTELLSRAQELKLTIPLFYAIAHIDRLFNRDQTSTFNGQLEIIRPNMLSASIMHWLLSKVLKPHHPSCDERYDAIARFLLYVRSHYIRMPLYLVVPHLLRKAMMQVFTRENQTT